VGSAGCSGVRIQRLTHKISEDVHISLIAFALLHAHTAECVAAWKKHLWRVRRRHDVVANSASVRFQLLRKTCLQQGSRLQLVAQVLLLLAHHLLFQLLFQPLSDFLSYAVNVTAAAQV
jgi:hypothetical protein